MKKLTCATILLFAMSILAMPYSAAAQTQAPTKSGSSLIMPVTGSGTAGTFTGTFNLKTFVVKDGQVWASGILSGTLTTAAGIVTTIVKNVLLPVTAPQTSCEILLLDLGPISIDLLGLQIDLSRIVLEITAVPGAGNLLCAVANLLNDPAGLARTLNAILDILR